MATEKHSRTTSESIVFAQYSTLVWLIVKLNPYACHVVQQQQQQSWRWHFDWFLSSKIGKLG
jgi:hypothetical protein